MDRKAWHATVHVVAKSQTRLSNWPGRNKCKSWTIKKAKHGRTVLWCWRRLMRVPRTARRSNQSILKEIGSEYSLEWLMLKLKLQYFDHPMQRSDSLEKTLVLGKIEDKRRKGQQRIRWLDSITDSVNLSLSKHYSLSSCSPWGCKESDRLSAWTTSTTIQDEIFKQLQ